MKLAEALLLRGDMQKKLASLRERIKQNALIQQGDQPHEDPNELYKQACGVLDELEALVIKINHANLNHRLPDGRSITDAIARRDTLSQQHALLTVAIGASTQSPDVYSMREVKWVATMKVSSLQRQADDVAKNLRELNARIQEANWQAEVA